MGKIGIYDPQKNITYGTDDAYARAVIAQFIPKGQKYTEIPQRGSESAIPQLEARTEV